MVAGGKRSHGEVADGDDVLTPRGVDTRRRAGGGDQPVAESGRAADPGAGVVTGGWWKGWLAEAGDWRLWVACGRRCWRKRVAGGSGWLAEARAGGGVLTPRGVETRRSDRRDLARGDWWMAGTVGGREVLTVRGVDSR